MEEIPGTPGREKQGSPSHGARNPAGNNKPVCVCVRACDLLFMMAH